MGYEEFDKKASASDTVLSVKKSLILTAVKIFFGIALGFCLAFLCLMFAVHRLADEEADEQILSRQHRTVSDEDQAALQASHTEAATPSTTDAPTSITPIPTNAPLVCAQPPLDHEKNATSVEEQLFRSVRITCFVLMTIPEELTRHTQRVQDSWANRCNKIVYVTTSCSPPVSPLPNVVELPGEAHSWLQLKNTLEYLYTHHQNDTDYFLRADDASLVLLDNMRHMLYPYSPDMPLFFGSHDAEAQTIENDVLAGVFVLSRKALIALAEQNRKPAADSFERDSTLKELVAALRLIDARRGNAQDERQKERFVSVQPRSAISPVMLWYRIHAMLNMCSKRPVSLHPVSMFELYTLQFLAFQYQPLGLADKHTKLPAKLDIFESMQLPKMRDFNNV